jgi:hypothetical protein
VPTREEIGGVCSTAVKLIEAHERGRPLPVIDRFERWLCGYDGGEPLALVMTAESLDQIETQESGRWRYAIGPDIPGVIEDFERRLFAQTHRHQGGGYFLHNVFIYKRMEKGRVIKHGATGEQDVTGTGEPPTGLPAQPWESERLLLAERYPTITSGPERGRLVSFA